jgi:hypothetical protein
MMKNTSETESVDYISQDLSDGMMGLQEKEGKEIGGSKEDEGRIYVDTVGFDAFH